MEPPGGNARAPLSGTAPPRSRDTDYGNAEENRELQRQRNIRADSRRLSFVNTVGITQIARRWREKMLLRTEPVLYGLCRVLATAKWLPVESLLENIDRDYDGRVTLEDFVDFAGHLLGGGESSANDAGGSLRQALNAIVELHSEALSGAGMTTVDGHLSPSQENGDTSAAREPVYFTTEMLRDAMHTAHNTVMERSISIASMADSERSELSQPGMPDLEWSELLLARRSDSIGSAEGVTAITTSKRFVAIVAHNDMKPAMMTFVASHLAFFRRVKIVTTGTTGRAVEQTLGLSVAKKVNSGPLGGDQEIGAMICNGEVCAVFFFRDPLSSHPHMFDILALCRLCDVHSTMVATNAASGEAVMYSLNNSPELSRQLDETNHAHEVNNVLKAYQDQQTSVVAQQVQSRTQADHGAK